MVDMYIQPIILAGGAGSRLWPASREGYPKPLLALTGARSLLQETALRLQGFSNAPVAPDPVVVTNNDYRFLVAEQLREVGLESPLILLEPMGRNTAPALTLAALFLANAGDSLLLVMPSDHVITNTQAFHSALADAVIHAEAGRLVTFGITPDRPETAYGYIQAGETISETSAARRLVGFREKPDCATAASLIATGSYLWNSGIFLTRQSVWLAALAALQPDILSACQAAVAGAKRADPFVWVDREAFAACPADSIDYAVMEQLGKAPSGPGCASKTTFEAAVVPLDAGWSDVGTWETLWGVLDKDAQGNTSTGAVVLEDTTDSLVHAESRLVAVLGCRDVVIVETPDAVLVGAKERTRDLKDLVARVRQSDPDLTVSPHRVRRPWGYYEGMDRGRAYQVKHIVVNPGASLSLQLHQHRAEHWVVVQGVADITCGDRKFRLLANESTYIPPQTAHRIENPGPQPLEIIEVQSGDYLGEDDIIRLSDQYGRA